MLQPVVMNFDVPPKLQGRVLFCVGFADIAEWRQPFRPPIYAVAYDKVGMQRFGIAIGAKASCSQASMSVEYILPYARLGGTFYW